MNPSSGATVALTCHPTTPCSAVRGIQVEIRRAADAALALRYALDGDLSRLLIPAHSTPRRADKLWQHTCFELFCADGATAAYYELNFSPSSEWAIYRFDTYREGMAAVETQRAPGISVHQHPGGLHMHAIVDLSELSALRDCPALRLALAAVIEEADGRLSYWALAHPAAKPDFHHAGGFVLSLPRDDFLSARDHAL
jgi:hypothetical protein